VIVWLVVVMPLSTDVYELPLVVPYLTV